MSGERVNAGGPEAGSGRTSAEGSPAAGPEQSAGPGRFAELGSERRQRNAPLLYFAAPLFNESERTFNAELAARLESLGYSVFLPQRDGVESAKEPYASMSREERRAAMFALDRDTIYRSDVFLFVLDGRVPDEGACVELGLAYADRWHGGRDRRIVGLQTDIRAAFMRSRLNPMILVALDEVYESTDTLVPALYITDATETNHPQ